MDRFAIFSYVASTRLSYDNTATRGVETVASKLMKQVEPIFKKGNIADLGPLTTRQQILSTINDAATRLEPDGLCLFYFHGHGDSLPGRGLDDEAKDQVLVCHDHYLFDDDLSGALLNFRSTQRILSIVDSCSSETVIEWSRYPALPYPQIIHLAGARDEEVALATLRGGKFSNKFLKIIEGFAYEDLTYKAFTTRMQTRFISTPCYVTVSPNTTSQYLHQKLFH